MLIHHYFSFSSSNGFFSALVFSPKNKLSIRSSVPAISKVNLKQGNWALLCFVEFTELSGIELDGMI